MGDSAVTTFWDAPNGGALTGTERFGADKAGSGDPADSPHYTADQIKAFALLGLTPAQIGAATAAESAAALAAAQGAQTTANAAQDDATQALSDAAAALAPTVQSAHTTSTRTLALGDLNQIIPLSAASNAIAITIPHTLFASAGTGRAFACACYVTSVAGGAITFAGSGGIVIKYFGKKPSATAIVAGDTIFVTVVSATLAHVWISAEIP